MTEPATNAALKSATHQTHIDHVNERLVSATFTDAGRTAYTEITNTIENLMVKTLDELPDSRDRAVLLAKLEVAHLWVGKACRTVA